ncbi:MAG: hypothetical protein ACJAYE_003347 [Candidatus Azotimanducaceae bacterium]
MNITVPTLMKHRASLLGEVVEEWLARIDDLLAEVEGACQFSIQ